MECEIRSGDGIFPILRYSRIDEMTNEGSHILTIGRLDSQPRPASREFIPPRDVGTTTFNLTFPHPPPLPPTPPPAPPPTPPSTPFTPRRPPPPLPPPSPSPSPPPTPNPLTCACKASSPCLTPTNPKPV